MSRRNWDSVEGVVDVGPLVIAHCNNPAKSQMLEFLQEVLTGKTPAVIPVSTFLGAYHILTRYLKISRQDATIALEETLDVDSPAFFEEISRYDVKNAIKIAGIKNIESWDGYLANVARRFGTQVIYSIDEKLTKKGFKIINPIQGDILDEYHAWVVERVSEKKR